MCRTIGTLLPLKWVYVNPSEVKRLKTLPLISQAVKSKQLRYHILIKLHRPRILQNTENATS